MKNARFDVATPYRRPLGICAVAALFFLVFAGVAYASTFIVLGDDRYFLADTQATDKGQLREYIPAGQTLTNWERLVSVRVFSDLKDPEAYLRRLGSQVVHDHPAARAQLLQNPQTKAYVLDFMTFPPEATRPYYAEWNLMRATDVEGKGLIVYQYARRIYDVGPQTGLIVNAERNKMMAPFSAAAFEEQEDTK
jgi:hypothetical protein